MPVPSPNITRFLDRNEPKSDSCDWLDSCIFIVCYWSHWKIPTLVPELMIGAVLKIGIAKQIYIRMKCKDRNCKIR